MSEPVVQTQESAFLVYGQLAEEVRTCMAAGGEPDVAGLVARFPSLADEIRQIIDAQRMLERLGDAPPAPAADRDPTLPQLLGDYRLGRVIGRGGMGVVFEAE